MACFGTRGQTGSTVDFGVHDQEHGWGSDSCPVLDETSAAHVCDRDAALHDELCLAMAIPAACFLLNAQLTLGTGCHL